VDGSFKLVSDKKDSETI